MKGLFNKIAWRARNLTQRYLRDPITTVTEFKHRISYDEQTKYGWEARSHQVIADALLFGVEYVVGASVEGDIAEFGSMTGRTATVIAAAMASAHTKKGLHLFDSFEGLPKATNAVDASSVHVRDGVWGPGTCLGITPKALRQKCQRYLAADKVAIYEGWYCNTMSQFPKCTLLGMLHIDCDLYQSTIDVLDHVFKHKMIAEGALILFDDWNCNRASNQWGERKAWLEMVAKYHIQHSDEGSYSWGGHKFIIHGYAV